MSYRQTEVMLCKSSRMFLTILSWKQKSFLFPSFRPPPYGDRMAFILQAHFSTFSRWLSRSMIIMPGGASRKTVAADPFKYLGHHGGHCC